MKITTFYSYKGGLGRSLMLAWASRALAHRGRRVVALDFDLEAPGLHFKLGFGPRDDLGPGLVGLLSSFQRGDPPPDSLHPFVRLVPAFERLWLLPAGPMVSREYWRTLASISWEELFFKSDLQGARFFHWLREALRTEFNPDHVLVDARTGVTEMGGAALSLLPDQVLALVGTSPESIHGTREILRAVVSSPRSLDRVPPRMALILSRMPASLTAMDLQRKRRTVRDDICEEADPLTATVSVDLPLVIRSEPSLQSEEQLAFGPEELRVHEDYRAVVDWLEGATVPQEAPGPSFSPDTSIQEFHQDIALLRQLAERRPDEYLPDLASALNDLGHRLSDTGRREAALAATEEAVALYRALADACPEAFTPDLAASLNNLSNCLGALGRREEALAVIEEAVQFHRALAAARPKAFQPNLATSLNNLSVHLDGLGRREEALDANKAAVSVYRELADTRPEAFRHHLAASLNNLSNSLEGLGRREAALAAIEEAVAVYRELAAARPEAFRPHLAMSLNNLSNRLGVLGRREEGLAAIDEAVTLRRELAAQRPEAFRPDLATSLNNLSNRLEGLGRREEALAASEEAVELLAPFFLQRPRVFAHWMRIILDQYSQLCAQAGREPDPQRVQPLLEELGKLVE